MQCLNNKNKLLDLLAQGATAITPNNRLSAALIQDYFIHCNKRTLEKPACLPFRSALIKAYDHQAFLRPNLVRPVLLNQTQCQHIWRRIIQADNRITYSEGLLHAVIEAWTHGEQWQLSPEHTAFNHSEQTQQFAKWWQLFTQQVNTLDAITEQNLIPYLLKNKSLFFSQPLIWACFDDFTTQQFALQDHLNQNQIDQYIYDLPENQADVQVLAAIDNKEETQQLLAWLHLKIAQGQKQIGVVVPDLHQSSQTLIRTLTEHFAPELFNVSMGQPLTYFPLISHAMTLLNLNPQQINHHQMMLLLQSPYIGHAKTEFLARSQFLQDSHLMQHLTIPLEKLISQLRTPVPQLAQLLGEIKVYPTQASAQEWVVIFQKRLNNLGFPGEYEINSENYQCFNRFTAIFDELRQLSFLAANFTAKEALDSLAHLLENTIFQAQKTNALIQICGLLEASGCEFNSLWVTGLTDQCLPQKVRLSAFIPPSLQRDLNMPHAVASRELQFAKQTLQRLQKGSEQVVFSFPLLQGDNPNLPSALIANHPVFKPLPQAAHQSQKVDLIREQETYQVPLQSNEKSTGGTALLANQAKCPFKAFAEHRLRAKPLPETVDGISHRERGQMAHKVMELLWSMLGTQQQLLQLSTKDLDELIDKALKMALAQLTDQTVEACLDLIQEVEYQRLKRLVISCLEWEKQRSPFTVAAIEQSYAIDLTGLNLQVRVDRIDQVGDKKWVIDYKSSMPTCKPWNEDRPKEPQMLLYALLDDQINTLLFMQLKSGQMACSGLSEEKHQVSGIQSIKSNSTWIENRLNWQQQLTFLAEEFLEGYAPPQPANLAICQSCDFQSLCRFQPTE